MLTAPIERPVYWCTSVAASIVAAAPRYATSIGSSGVGMPARRLRRFAQAS